MPRPPMNSSIVSVNHSCAIGSNIKNWHMSTICFTDAPITNLNEAISNNNTTSSRWIHEGMKILSRSRMLRAITTPNHRSMPGLMSQWKMSTIDFTKSPSAKLQVSITYNDIRSWRFECLMTMVKIITWSWMYSTITSKYDWCLHVFTEGEMIWI